MSGLYTAYSVCNILNFSKVCTYSKFQNPSKGGFRLRSSQECHFNITNKTSSEFPLKDATFCQVHRNESYICIMENRYMEYLLV